MFPSPGIFLLAVSSFLLTSPPRTIGLPVLVLSEFLRVFSVVFGASPASVVPY